MSSRQLIARVATLALTAGLLLPPAGAGAKQDDAPAPPTVVESTTGSYVVVMDADPLVATHEVSDLGSSAAQADAEEMVDSHDEALEDAGVDAGEKVQDFTNAVNGFSAQLTYAEAVRVASRKGVKLVQPDELHQVQTDASGEFLGLSGKGQAWDSGVTGEDVVVGVIDTGIWPEHPSFADDGSYGPSPIPALDDSIYPSCDFGNVAHNADDAAFSCNNKLLGARQVLPTYRALIGADADEFDSARDDDGHGTHTASTAAGNADVQAEMYGRDMGTVSGVAPRSRVIAYKALGNLGGFTSDLTAAIDQAVADGVDVINYSVGGGPSLSSADAIAYLFAADAGVFVATSAGNSGPGEATMGGPAVIPWITAVGASTQDRFFEGTATLTDGAATDKGKGKTKKSGASRLEVTGASVTDGTDGVLRLVDAEFAGGDLCLPGTLNAALVDGAVVLCRRGAIGRAAKSEAVAIAGGVGMILYNNDDTDNLFTDNHFVPSVHLDNTPGLDVKAFIASAAQPMASITTGETSNLKKAPTMAIFSSRGPNPVAGDLIKPDVTAPGVQILAGASPFPGPGARGGELFQAIAGTSMSSPHVAGLFALLKQVHPDWSAAMAKSALMTTAYQDVLDNDRTTPAGPFAMGAGHVDPGKVTKKGSSFDPGLVYDAGLFEYAAFTCGAEAGIFSSGSCDFLEGLGLPTDASDLNLPSIGVADLAGTQTVTRSVTSVASRTIKWKAKTDAPAGYDVTVQPSTLTLAPGETASFTVTITNDGSAPVGEWRTGQLEWKGAGYKATSPIAVRGAAFNGPELLLGSGAAGTGSFDVQFGYSGAYTATGLGLTPNSPAVGDISQDGDQTYPSGDDGLGVDLIEFNVIDSAFVRWQLFIPGPDDVDLYLHDSSGAIIASSTNGGTDELIELLLPADDTYTLAVHGWSVPNEPLPYSVSFWDIPAAGGGSLSVDAAPASASVGLSGTIDYSWTGAALGINLGAISHEDESGILGITLVEITG